MLSKEENDLLCRVGHGTPMGALMRQYWLPALLSSELPRSDGPPIRLRLLGENLIGFRTAAGRPAIIENHCPHRGASLFFGRNEEEGLRCVYHGWKFDVTGACVDMPSEPPESTFKERVRAAAYPCVERGGVVWTYMGASDPPPPLPDLEPNLLPEGEYAVQKVLRECNWVQGMEGDIDTGHLAFLHLGAVQPEDMIPDSFDYYIVKDRAPGYEAIDTEYGTSYAAGRDTGDGTIYWRIAHFIFPFYTMIPTGVLGVQVLARAWVPLDDDNMMFWSFTAPRTRSIGQGGFSNVGFGTPPQLPANDRSSASVTGMTRQMEFLPDTTDWLGRFRLAQNAANDYRIDREEQRTRSYTGITGVHQQDQAVTESMGPVYDRSQEHLAGSDAMVIRTRRRLIEAAEALRDDGTPPPGATDPAIYRQRSGGVVLPEGVHWLAATAELRKAFVKHELSEVAALAHTPPK